MFSHSWRLVHRPPAQGLARWPKAMENGTARLDGEAVRLQSPNRDSAQCQ